MKKELLTEIYNIKNGFFKKKDGTYSKIMYIDPKTSENTYNIKDELKNFDAKFLPNIDGDPTKRAWGWYLGQNPQWVMDNKIKPCLDYLLSIEKNPNNEERNVIAIIDKLLAELKANPVIQEPNPSVPNESVEVNTTGITDKLEQFKRELIDCVSSEEFKVKMEPIIKFRNARGHSFSFTNILLFYIQNPKVTMVKSKGNWEAANRTIKPGEQPMVAWVGKQYSSLSKEEKEKRINKFLADVGKNDVNELNVGEKERLAVFLKPVNRTGGFKLTASFYDISQTMPIDGREDLVGDGGEDLPWFDDSSDVNEKTTELCDTLLSVIESTGVKINTVDDLGGARGVSKSGSIDYLSSSPKNIGTFNTLAHEFSHELLHQTYLKDSNKNPNGYGRFFVGKAQGRSAIEQQAELSAWLVCRFFGYDVPTNINYVGMWGLDEKNAVKVFDEVAKVASWIYKKVSIKLKNNMTESKTFMVNEITGREVAELVGCGEVYDRSKEEETKNDEALEKFQTQFNEWTEKLTQYRRKPKFRL